MKKISIKRTVVRCDTEGCGWKKEDEPKNWHNIKCPKCNDCIIVTDSDMKMAETTRNLVNTLGELMGDADENEEMIEMSIGTNRKT